MDGPLYGTRQHLHRMWLEWSQQDAVPMEESEVRRGVPCRTPRYGVELGAVPMEDTKV